MGKIIWLASYPKSGNTWLRAFLHNLLQGPRPDFDINRIADFGTEDSLMRWFRPLDARPWQEWSPQDIAAMRRPAQEAICAWRQEDIFVKTHNALVNCNGHPLIHPDLSKGAIYVVRNPLDVAVSLAGNENWPADKAIDFLANPTAGAGTDARAVYELRASWSIHVASWTQKPSARLHVVRYEDMLARSRETFGAVMKFLGLERLDPRLQAAIDASSFDVLRRLEEAQGFKEKSAHAERFFRVGQAGQWREGLSGAQVERLVGAHKAQMRRFGYWPAEIT